DAQLLIAGEGPERQQLMSEIRRLQLTSSVTVLGHLSREEMERQFAGAWVQVVPSRWEEPFGLVAAEGSMRGTAVIASDTGGLAEIVRHNETGILFPPGNIAALSEAIYSLLADP